jgi:hypothetical protein
MSILDEHAGKFVAGGVALVVGAVSWLTRTVFTNNKRLQLLEQQLKFQKEARDLEIESIQTRQERSETTLAMIADDHRRTSENINANTKAMLSILEELKKNERGSDKDV